MSDKSAKERDRERKRDDGDKVSTRDIIYLYEFSRFLRYVSLYKI
jgi:hypothetical protein